MLTIDLNDFYYNSNLLNYSHSKNNYMEQLNKLNPVLYKNDKKIITMEDFNNGPKKIKILFVDNTSIDIYYKIIETK